jgi:hypothetical protein
VTELLDDRARAGPVYGFRFIEPEFLSLRDVSATFHNISVLYSLVAVASIPEVEGVEFSRPWQRESWEVPPEFQLYANRLRYESPLIMEAGLLWVISKVPEIIRRWTAAIEDVADLPGRIKDNRGKRREADEERRLRQAEREARHEQLRKAAQREDLAPRELEVWKADLELRRRLAEAGRELTQADMDRARRAVDEAINNPETAIAELYAALEEKGVLEHYERVKRLVRQSPVQIEDAEVFEWVDDEPPGLGGGRASDNRL